MVVYCSGLPTGVTFLGALLMGIGVLLGGRRLALGRRLRFDLPTLAGMALGFGLIGLFGLFYYAGFTDKFQQLIGSVNPVSGPHHNFTTAEPVGVVHHQPAIVAALQLDEGSQIRRVAVARRASAGLRRGFGRCAYGADIGHAKPPGRKLSTMRQGLCARRAPGSTHVRQT